MANAQVYPQVAEGAGFSIQGDVGFQSPAYVTGTFSSSGFTFYIETLTGTLNGSDAQLGMNARGGTLSFHNNILCEVQLWADMNISLTISGAGKTQTIPNQSWNSTFTADVDVQVTWGYQITQPWETYFTFIMGVLGVALLFGGMIMLAYAVREHRWWILDADKTMLGIISICLLVFGIGLVFYWLMS